VSAEKHSVTVFFIIIIIIIIIILNIIIFFLLLFFSSSSSSSSVLFCSGSHECFLQNVDLVILLWPFRAPPPSGPFISDYPFTSSIGWYFQPFSYCLDIALLPDVSAFHTCSLRIAHDVSQ
jgi:hypothetical protein